MPIGHEHRCRGGSDDANGMEKLAPRTAIAVLGSRECGFTVGTTLGILSVFAIRPFGRAEESCDFQKKKDLPSTSTEFFKMK